MYSDMSMRTMRLFVVEEELGEGARSFGLANAGRPEEDESSRWAAWGRSSPRANGESRWRRWTARHPGRRLARAAAPPSATSFCTLAFEHLGDGNPGPLADDRGDVLLVDLFLEHARARRLCRPGAALSCFSSASSLGSSPYWICAARSSCPCGSAPPPRSASPRSASSVR